MEEQIEKLKKIISDAEETLKDPSIASDAELVQLINDEIDIANKELAKLQPSVEKAVDVAEKNLKEAKKDGDKTEIKEAKKVLNEAEVSVKEVEKIATKVESLENKVEKVEKKRGGSGRGQGRKKGSKNKKSSSVTKMVKPAKYKPKRPVRKFVKRVVVKKKAKVAVKPAEKMKSVRAFGQNVQYKNDAEFCKKLINAFKKRKAVSKKLRKKTKPVFGIITTKVKDAVSKAIDNTPKNVIEKNPKAFLAKAQRLEKSAIRFLEDFKAILGTDFKKSEISAEFGDLEKSIKKLVSKYKK
jgi:hypothetical protein